MGTTPDARINESSGVDWSAARVVYELRLRGLSLRGLSLRHGHSASWLHDTVRGRARSGEDVIAKALRRRPSEIWPSRYVKRSRR
jgi:Ner family transcriptional regulator